VSNEQAPEEQELADLLKRVARAFSISPAGEATRDVIVEQAVAEIPGAEMANLSVTSVHGLHIAVASSDDLAKRAGKLEHEHAEGPCFAAGTTGETYISARLADDDRWPRYGPAVAEIGIVSQMGVNIFVQGTSGMSLDVYSTQPAAFDRSRQTAELFCSQAAVAIGFSETATELKQGMLSRGLIGQAIGIVMERYQVNETRAFAFLVRASRDGNIKLRDIAARLVESNNESDPD
jgi:hypothetical protein